MITQRSVRWAGGCRRKAVRSLACTQTRAQASLSAADPMPEGSVNPQAHLPFNGEGSSWSGLSSRQQTRQEVPLEANGASSYRPLVLENLIHNITTNTRAVSPSRLFVSGENRNIDTWQASSLVSAIYVCLQTGNIDRALKIAENRRRITIAQKKAVEMSLKDGTISNDDAEQGYKDIDALNHEIYDIRIHNGFLQAYIESMDRVPGRGRWEAAVRYYRNLGPGWNLRPSDTTTAIMLKGCAKQHNLALTTSEPPDDVILQLLHDLVQRTGQKDFSHQLHKVLQDPHLSKDVEGFKSVVYAIKRAIAKTGDNPLKIVGHNKLSRSTLQSMLDKLLTGAHTSQSSQEEQHTGPSKTLSVPPVKSVSKPVIKEEGEDDSIFGLKLLQSQLGEMVQANSLGLTPIERQRQLEVNAYDVGRARIKHAYEDEMARTGKQSEAIIQRRSVRTLLWQWHVELEKHINEQLAKRKPIKHSKKNNGLGHKFEAVLGEALSLLSPEKLSNITISEMIYLTGSDTGSSNIPLGIKTARALLAVGKAVEQEHHSEILSNQGKKEHERRRKIDERTHGLYSSGKIYDARVREALRKEHMKSEDTDWLPKWTDPDRARVGSLLVGMLLDVAKVRQYAKDPETGETIFQDSPAFHHTYQYIQGKRQGLIKLHPTLSEQLAQESVSQIVHPRLLPMLVLPRPWISWNNGGYHFTNSQMMRTKFCPEQVHYLREASNRNQLNTIFNGLDVLGSTAWMVNQHMFDVVLEAWNKGLEIGKLPALAFDKEPPVKPDDPSDQAKRATYQKELLAHLRTTRDKHSRRCDVNYKLEIARAFLGEVMYFPHSLDFRGRAYPIPPNFNHMGNDLCRGLLLFAEAKPLGEAGLRWLKVHLAGKFGFDKANFVEREQWTQDHLDQIFDSADNPLDGKRWWLGGDDPWQTLAACKELASALRSPQPTEYLSRLPIHQDGTCNGLQHYAALGGDAAGARQVNLMPGDKPADVYSGVADIVRADIVKDANAGLEVAQILQDKITRKVVKQTIMTTVYGVTFIGAQDQIISQLKDRGDIPKDKMYEAGIYLAKKVLRSIGTEFKGASAIQVWLTETARLIAKSVAPERIHHVDETSIKAASDHGKRNNQFLHEVRQQQMTAVIWTSPVGLTCVQPYRREAKTQIQTSLQTIYIQDPNVAMPVDPGKQASAFAPNFIHSLDASHMFLTAIECKARDLTFASVHDSYWTHACDIDSMSELIRATFIRLHTAKLLENLRKEFVERYKGHKVAVVSVGSAAHLQSASQNMGLHPVSDERLDQLPGIDMTPEEVQAAAENALKERNKKRTALQSAEIEFADIDGNEDTSNLVDEDEVSSLQNNSSAPLKEDIRTFSKAAQKANIKDLALQHARGKWVELVDIIPELPERGQFDVEMTKSSLYFFS